MIMGFWLSDASHRPMCGCPGLPATEFMASLLEFAIITSHVLPLTLNVVALVCNRSSHVSTNLQMGAQPRECMLQRCGGCLRPYLQ